MRLVLLLILLLLLGIFSLPHLSITKSYYLLDSAVNFQVQAMALCAVMAVLSLLLSRLLASMFLLTTVAAVMVNLILPFNGLWYEWQASDVGNAKVRLKLVQANLHYYNSEKNAAFEGLHLAAADVYVLLEVNDKDRERFAKLRGDKFDYGYAEVEGFPAGIGVISKFPIVKRQLHQFPGSKAKVLQLTLAVENELFELVVLHPPSPRTSSKWQQRNDIFDYTTLLLQTPASHRLVAGDLNATPWSANFIKMNTLSPCYASQGYYVSWYGTDWLKKLGAVGGLPIDHCFASDALTVSAFKTVPLNGSDHLGLSYNLSW